MPRWIVDCPHCKKEFTHTDLAAIVMGFTLDPFVSPPKPEIPESGTEVKCPHCNESSTYRGIDLRYRKD